MAQSRSRPSHHLTSSSSPSTSPALHRTPILRSTSPQIQPIFKAVTGIEGLSYLQQDSQEVETRLEIRPAKRQKVLEEGGGHKFVSQKRWKFLEGQPWLPSKVSSKAQNASKVVNKIKQEPTSPRTPLSPITTHSVQEGQNLHPSQPLRKNEGYKPQFQSTKASQQPHNAVVHSPRVATGNRDGLAMDVASVKSPRENFTETVVRERSQTHDAIEQYPLVENDSNDDYAAEFPGTASTDMSKSRLQRSGNALSLQKDRERIAVLIAEKRKENESNMFRERLLQRQLQYKSQKDIGKVLDTNSEPETIANHDLNLSAATTNISATEQLFPITNHESFSASDSAESQPTAHIQQISSQHIAESSRATASSANPHEQIRVTMSARNVNSGPPGALPPSRTLTTTGPLSSNENEFAFGNGPTPQSATANARSRARRVNSDRDGTARSLSEDFCYEGDDTNRAARSGTFTNQVAGMPIRAVDSRVSQTVHRDSALKRNTPASNPTPIGKSHVPQRLSSTIPTYDSRTKDVTNTSTPSPADLASSYSPTSFSAHQFAQINISPHRNQHAAMQGSFPIQSRPASTGHPSSNHGAYYAADRPTWTSPGHSLGQPSSTHPAIQPEAASFQHRPYAPLAAAAGLQQQIVQPPILTSNVNMFSGNARSNIGNGVGVVPQKPRVNMFSDTRGTPFPMHEVIRQIEMT